MESDTETWRAVTGAEGRLEVSDLGRVRTVARTVNSNRGWRVKLKSHLLKTHFKGPYKAVNAKIRDGHPVEFVHRLVFFAFHGDLLPDEQVDHIDRNTANNCASNLRRCHKSENLINTFKSKSRKPGAIVGVSKTSEGRNPWLAYITVRRKRIHLGVFATQLEAAHARAAAEKLHFNAFAPDRQLPPVDEKTRTIRRPANGYLRHRVLASGETRWDARSRRGNEVVSLGTFPTRDLAAAAKAAWDLANATRELAE